MSFFPSDDAMHETEDKFNYHLAHYRPAQVTLTELKQKKAVLLSVRLKERIARS